MASTEINAGGAPKKGLISLFLSRSLNKFGWSLEMYYRKAVTNLKITK